jgi:hypothetical protein
MKSVSAADEAMNNVTFTSPTIRVVVAKGSLV